MPAYLHWIVYLPIAVFCASAAAAAVTNAIAGARARPAAAPRPAAKIYYFSAAKTPLRSGTGAARPQLRLVSNGG